MQSRSWQKSTAHLVTSALDFSLDWCNPFRAGEFRLGREQVKKTLATVILLGLPTLALGMQSSQNAPQQEQAPAAAGSSTAKAHHSKHHKHSKTHHKVQKHHATKQHPQTQ